MRLLQSRIRGNARPRKWSKWVNVHHTNEVEVRRVFESWPPPAKVRLIMPDESEIEYREKSDG